MKRPRAAKKSRSPRRASAGNQKPPAHKPAPAALDADAVYYLQHLAAALTALMEAQSRWIPEIDAASRNQSLVNDRDWRVRITTALGQMIDAAEGLRVQPVPSSMRAVDGAMGDAQSEARLASDGFAEAVENADLRTMLASVEHIDRMNHFIQRARTLVSG